MWSWANETTSVMDRLRMEAVRNFGREHDLQMLTDGEWRGGRAEGLEAVAIAGRILDADGVLLNEHGDLTMFFALFDFRETA